MKLILPLALAAACMVAPLCAGDSVADSIAPTTDESVDNQKWFGPPYIQFGRNFSSSHLPGYTVGTASYTHKFTSDFDKKGLGDVSSDTFNIWVPFLALNREQYHLFAWINYGTNKYKVGNNSKINMLPESTMQSIYMPVVFINDVSEKWLWGGMVMPTYSGTGSNSDNFAISGAVGVGYTYSADLQLFGGVYYYNGFNDTTILPGAGFIWRPNDRWEAFLLPPIGGVSYSINDNWLASLYGQYESPTWHAEADDLGPDRDVNMQSLRIGLKLEYHIHEWFWAYAAGGLSMGQTLEVENSHNDKLQKSDIDASPYVQVGLNIRF
jgi:hypothetical protein